MRIVKVIHGYPPLYNAGSEVYSSSVCEELSKENQVFVFTREENPYIHDFHVRKEKINNNLELYIVNKAREKDGYRHPVMDKIFLDLLGNFRPDVVHIGHLNHMSTGIVDQLVKEKIPTVFTLHDFWLMCPRGQFLQINFGNPDYYQLCSGQNDDQCARSCYNYFFSGRVSDAKRDHEYWKNWIHTRMTETRDIMEKIDLFIAPSVYLMKRFINQFSVPPEKIKYLDYGFPMKYLKPPRDTHNGCFTFGYIGTHIPPKGVNILIKAFSKLRLKSKLIIWGRPNGQSTEAMKTLAGSSHNEIEFRGEYRNQNIVHEVFSHIDCLVVPSVWTENSPLVIHEAQACRIPVITADAGGMEEYVQHEVNGLLFKHRDVRDLENKLSYAIRNEDHLRTLGRRGYLFSERGDVIDIRVHCDELLKIYQRVIKKYEK